MQTFRQHLTEAFKLQPVDYGTNETLDDKGTEYYLGGSSTFFEFNGRGYLVQVDDRGAVSFGSSRDITNDEGEYDMRRASTEHPLKVLGSVMYVAGELIRKIKPPMVTFSGADKGLDRLYGKIVQNKSFLDIMSKIGYEYIGKDKDTQDYIFTKK